MMMSIEMVQCDAAVCSAVHVVRGEVCIGLSAETESAPHMSQEPKRLFQLRMMAKWEQTDMSE